MHDLRDLYDLIVMLPGGSCLICMLSGHVSCDGHVLLKSRMTHHTGSLESYNLDHTSVDDLSDLICTSYIRRVQYYCSIVRMKSRKSLTVPLKKRTGALGTNHLGIRVESFLQCARHLIPTITPTLHHPIAEAVSQPTRLVAKKRCALKIEAKRYRQTNRP